MFMTQLKKNLILTCYCSQTNSWGPGWTVGSVLDSYGMSKVAWRTDSGTRFLFNQLQSVFLKYSCNNGVNC